MSPSILKIHRFRTDVPPEGGTIGRNRRPDYAIDHATACWLWLRAIDGQGYGSLNIGPTIFERRAHREYYRRANGPTPPGFHVHHRCENRRCVNPAHLEATSHEDHLTAHKQFDSGLSWADVNEIRRIHGEGGTSIQELALRYGIGKSEVDNIVRNIKWRDPDYTPGRPTECELCGEAFTATRSHQRFCRPEHQQKWNSLRRRVPGGYAERRAA